MHCNTNLIKSVLFIAIPVLLFTACSQGSDSALSNPDDNGGYASDASRIEWANDDVISIADAAGLVYNGSYLGSISGVTVATDTIDNPHTLIIRFGTNNGGTSTENSDFVCLDGRKRRGAIIVSYSGNYPDTAQVHTITYDNYYINDNQLTGNVQTRRFVDSLVPGDWYYGVLVNDSLNMTPTTLNNQYITWTGSFDRKWVSGYLTPSNRNNEVFAVSGNATLTRANGHQFTFNISSPLQFAINCNFAESGIATVSGNQGARVLNYGSGSCDPDAQLNIGNSVYNITLTP